MLRKLTYILAAMLIIPLMVGCAGLEETTEPQSPEYWPTEAWRTSTPEEQDMDAAKLSMGVEKAKELYTGVDCILIIRNGYIVHEEYPKSVYTKDLPRNLSTATESYTSALTGIALKEGNIDSLEQKVVDFFTERTIDNLDARKESMTLEHLLTMTSGFEWKGYEDSENLLYSMDSVRFMLDLPMAADPGERFQYSMGNPQLLSAIIAKSTGQDTLDFAREFLFEPLGITRVNWDQDPKGVYYGGYALVLKPRDAAKLGYLYLHKGVWDGQQIVPADYVANSIKPHNSSVHYGYLWCIDTENKGFFALGWNGAQLIYVIPELDLVAVFTTTSRQIVSGDLIHQGEAIASEYIVGACK